MEYKKVKRKRENKNKTAKQENTQNKQNERDINTQGHRTKVQKKKLIEEQFSNKSSIPCAASNV